MKKHPTVVVVTAFVAVVGCGAVSPTPRAEREDPRLAYALALRNEGVTVTLDCEMRSCMAVVGAGTLQVFEEVWVADACAGASCRGLSHGIVCHGNRPTFFVGEWADVPRVAAHVAEQLSSHDSAAEVVVCRLGPSYEIGG